MSQSPWWKECGHSVWELQHDLRFQPHVNHTNRDLQKGFYSFHFLSNIASRKWKLTDQVVIKALKPGQENPGFCLHIWDIKLPAIRADISGLCKWLYAGFIEKRGGERKMNRLFNLFCWSCVPVKKRVFGTWLKTCDSIAFMCRSIVYFTQWLIDVKWMHQISGFLLNNSLIEDFSTCSPCFRMFVVLISEISKAQALLTSTTLSLIHDIIPKTLDLPRSLFP